MGPEIRCVAGLGNPGTRYEWTRHNAGFWVLDRVAEMVSFRWRRLGDAFQGTGTIGPREILLLKPLTYMNRSGEAVLECLQRKRLMPSELLVVVDDATLPAGRLRIRAAGSSGGHRGLSSVEESLGTRHYPRLRIGVGADEPVDGDLADFVLRPLDAMERRLYEDVVSRASLAVREIVVGGLATAMNRFNAEEPGSSGPAGRPAEEPENR